MHLFQQNTSAVHFVLSTALVQIAPNGQINESRSVLRTQLASLRRHMLDARFALRIIWTPVEAIGRRIR